MATPIFIELTDFSRNKVSVNINHIFSMTEDQHRTTKEYITSVSYYHIPGCQNCNTTILRTPERKESIVTRIRNLSLKENI